MKTTYDPIAKILHWLVFVLLAIEFTIAWTMPGVHRGASPTTLVDLHFSFGMLILVVTVLRILWRLTHHVPALGGNMPHYEKVLALTTHYALYAGLLIMPFAGWTWASSRGWPITFFNLFSVQPIIATGSSLGSLAGNVHSFLGVAIASLIGLHALAALRHHFILKDDILKRMLPQFKKNF